MLSAALLAFAAAAVQEQTPAVPESDAAAGSVIFVAQCRYRSGTRALLSHGFTAGDYVLALRSGGSASSWRITPQANGDLALDTVTVGPPRAADADAAIALYRWLVRRNFRAIPVSGLAAETARRGIDRCPEPYPFRG
jgi:hypothetical protein